MTDKEKLLKLFSRWRLEEYIPHHTEIEMFADYLIVNNVIPVVRCKDCKWYNPDTDCGFDEATGRRDHSKIVKRPYGECQGQNFHFTEDGFLRVGDDDFCSYGERRESDAVD